MRTVLISATLMACLTSPLMAAECRYLSEQTPNTLSINEDEQTVTLTSGANNETCQILRTSSETVSALDCPSGKTTIAFLNDYEEPTAFFVRGETFRWTCE